MKSDEEIMAETQAEIAKLGAALTVLERLITAAAGEEREALVVAHVAVRTERGRLDEWVDEWVEAHSPAREEQP